MKADPHAQRQLLELQAIDTTLAQLQHRRSTLPELAELAEIERQLAAREDDRLRAQDEVDQLDREIAQVERDVEQVVARRERDAARLASGRGPARELEALQAEVESLTRRQSTLEDAQLELMERREQAQEQLDQVLAGQAAAREQHAEVQQRRDALLAEVSAEETARQQARGPLVAQLPTDLVALYERIRSDYDGVGAAPLRAGRCGGCRLELAGNERARVKAAPPDEVVRCEECRRIMVRDEESGL